MGARNASPKISMRSPYWPLCERVDKACSAVGRVTTGVLSFGSRHNGPILSCGAVAIVRAGVGAHEKAVTGYFWEVPT